MSYQKTKIFHRMIAFLLFLLLSISLPFSKVKALENPMTGTAIFLDTVVTLTIYGSNESSLLDECYDLLDQYEHLFSRTIEGSDVWNINHSDGVPVEVSEETALLIDKAQSYSDLTEGAFDITIAPVLDLWDVQNNPGILPSSEEINSALSHVDSSLVLLSGTTVTLLDPQAEIDLGGIAKGYIADCLAAYLEEKGITSALINLGGDVHLLGSKPDGNDWNIGIQKPFGERDELISVISCSGKSVITSGTYERYFVLDDVIYHHIMDPKTGAPVQNELTSVSIISDNSMEGDILSTACLVLGLNKGMDLIESMEGYEALFITEDMTTYRSSGFPEEVS